MEKKNEIQVFTGDLGKLRMVTIDGKDYFIAKDVATILGYSNPRDAISRHCKGVVKHDSFRDGGNEISLIPEGDVYRLIIKSKLPEAERFEKWVFEEVLPSIKQNGAYVSKNITSEQELKLDKYSTNKKIRNTFKTCNLELIENEYRECMLYHKNKDGKEKNSIQNIIINSLVDRKQILINSGKGAFALAIAEVTNEIIKKQKETGNKSRGQTISYKNKIISKLEGEISTLNPSIDEFMCFNIHPISENYMYKPINAYNGGLSMARTDTYNTWIKRFPRDEALPKEKLNIKWDKPVKVFIKVDCLERFDVSNFIKAINDMLVNRIFDEDDKIVVDTQIQRNKVVDSYSEGRIYVCIRNVD